MDVRIWDRISKKREENMGSYTVRVRAFACSNLHMKADADPGSDPTPPRGSPARVRPTQHAWIQPAAPPSNRATIIGCSQASATSHGSFCHRFRVCASAVGSTFLRSGIRVAVDRGRQASHGRLPFRGEDEANPPPGGSGGRGGGARARRPRAALRGVLLGELPHRTRRRAPSHVAGRHQRHPHRRRHPPPLLPRLLRQRLRRLAAARRHGHHARREELRPQRRRLHLRLRRHRQHQDAGRGRLPRHRLLRRHPRPRRARQRQPAGRAELGGAPGPARRDGPGPGRGEDAAGPGPGPRRSGLRLRRQGAHVARPGRALGRAHGRHGALRAVPHARLLRCQREPGLRVAAAAALSGLRRRRRPRAARPAHPQRVRQRILPQPHVRRRAAALRPGALQQRAAGLPGAALQRQPRRLLGGLRRLHDQPRQRQPAHGGQRGDQAGLQESQFLIYIHTLVYILEATCY